MAWKRGGGLSRNIATTDSADGWRGGEEEVGLETLPQLKADGWRGGEEEVGLETLPQLIAQTDGVVGRRRLVSKHCYS